jgi:peptidoglycan/xylan/chitin deacetylase (PgdA/CDA1 family)
VAGAASAQNNEANALVGAAGILAPRASLGTCPGNPDPLGVARVVEIDTTGGPGFGFEHFKAYDFLHEGEVVLTFDDGPWPGTTERILETLKAECVRATFFLIGRNALAHPALVQREVAQGHTIAYHSFSHPMLDHMPLAAAQADIDRGIVAVDAALQSQGVHAAPFFRFPYFASTPPLLDWLERRRMPVFGADLWASDWNRMSPDQELALILGRIEESRGGIVLLHDTKAQTAAMLGPFLRALKARGFSIVDAVAAGGRANSE